VYTYCFPGAFHDDAYKHLHKPTSVYPMTDTQAFIIKSILPFILTSMHTSTLTNDIHTYSRTYMNTYKRPHIMIYMHTYTHTHTLTSVYATRSSQQRLVSNGYWCRHPLLFRGALHVYGHVCMLLLPKESAWLWWNIQLSGYGRSCKH